MRRRGFTLIELLVVIAIIGILAAMLFPVFARARESARKTQCLANVKNLATAINMYFADWDKGFPTLTDRRAIDYFNGAPGGGRVRTYPDVCNHAVHANPYLRHAVILEEYVKSVDVWRCPSAKTMNGAQFIVPMGPNGDWVQSYIDHEGEWGRATWDYGPCYPPFPTGWGGDVTDTFAQGRMASALSGSNLTAAGAEAGVFLQGIGTNGSITSLNLSTVQDAGRYVAVGDAGKQVELWAADGLAYPDTCRFSLCSVWASDGCCGKGVDWANCEWSRICSAADGADFDTVFNDPSARKALTRHMGGSNIGFLDGHAKWYLSDVIMMQSEPAEDPFFQGGLCSCWPGVSD